MARPASHSWAIFVLLLVLQPGVAWGTDPDKAAPSSSIGDSPSTSVFGALVSSPIVALDPATLAEFLPDSATTWQNEADVQHAEDLHFQAVLPRNTIDARHDTLYFPGPLRLPAGPEPYPAPDPAGDGAGGSNTTIRPPPGNAFDHGCYRPGGGYQAGPLAEMLNFGPEKDEQHNEYEEDQRWREHLYDSRHPLFGVGVGAASTSVVQLSEPSRKRKARSSTDDDSDASHPSRDFGPFRGRRATRRSRRRSAKSSLRRQSELPSVLFREPHTRPISHAQLVAEVRGIYASLVVIERKCIDVDNAQLRVATSQPGSKLNSEQWQALIALHLALLHEHHDFFLASHQPNSSPALRRLATRHDMPARMMRHGIYALLELMRRHLPGSSVAMTSFIHQTYSLLAAFRETAPEFEETWVECLGDLARYRLVLEDDVHEDREVWTSVSRHWYSRASDFSPVNGRLHHHLAVLAHITNPLQALFLFSKSLCVPVSFPLARISIQEALFDRPSTQLSPTDSAFLQFHAVLFSGMGRGGIGRLSECGRKFLSGLNSHIARSNSRWTQDGTNVALSSICAIMGYGAYDNPLTLAVAGLWNPGVHDKLETDFHAALELNCRTLEVVLRRSWDPNILSYVHVMLVFVNYVAQYPVGLVLIQDSFPWELLAQMLNDLLLIHAYVDNDGMPDADCPFPRPADMEKRPLPEDFAMRGLLYTENYFPHDWFQRGRASYEYDDDYFRDMEDPVLEYQQSRVDRILRLGAQLVLRTAGSLLRRDSETKLFTGGADTIPGELVEPVTTVEAVPSSLSPFSGSLEPLKEQLTALPWHGLMRGGLPDTVDTNSFATLLPVRGAEALASPSLGAAGFPGWNIPTTPQGSPRPEDIFASMAQATPTWKDEDGDGRSTVTAEAPQPSVHAEDPLPEATPLPEAQQALAEATEEHHGRESAANENPTPASSAEGDQDAEGSDEEEVGPATATPSTGPAQTCSIRCTECGKEFERPGELTKHRVKHTKPHPCKFCEYCGASRRDVNRHVGRKHSSNKTKIPCDAPGCEKEYEGRDALHKHQREKHGRLKAVQGGGRKKGGPSAAGMG